jgi:NADPH:quinone reductase-like Zn-dependent oxidoreductase
MRAVVCEKYGKPQNLKLVDVPKPAPKPGEILVRIKAVSVNSWDCDILRGAPIIRMIGPFRPPYKVLGADVAGIVEAIGSGVEGFNVGDAVFGDLSDSGWGGMAEFATGKAEHFAVKPETLSFEDAACLPQAGLLGLQGVKKFGDVQPGEKLLFNGAGGGAGMFALQIAKHMGAQTYAVDHKDKFDAMREFGADHLIDYQKTDFTKLDEKFDVIIDAVSTHPMEHYRRILAPNGRFVIMGGRMRSILGTLIASRREHPNAHQFNILHWRVNKDELTSLAEMVVSGDVKVFIDKTYPIEEAQAAVSAVFDGRSKGKIVISVA